MIDQVYDDLYVSSILAMRNQAIAKREGIRAVVRLDSAPRHDGQWDESHFALLDMPIEDGAYLDGSKIDTVTQFINLHIQADKPVLVHCAMGVSRSVSMAMAYLIAYERMSLAEAFGTVREGRVEAFPHEKLLVSLIDHYNLPYDSSSVYNPHFLAKLVEDV